MVYLVSRSQYESPLGHTLCTFEDETLLDWYQRVWVTDDLCRKLVVEAGFPDEVIEQSEVYEILSECGDHCGKTLPSDNSAWFLANMYDFPPPQSYDDLQPFIDSFEGGFCEGEIHFLKGSVEVSSNDDEIEYTWHLFDSEFAKENPDRVDFLLHQTKELPITFQSNRNFNTRIPTLKVSDYQTNGPTTYACFLSAMDGETIGDIDGCFSFPVRLPDFTKWLKSQQVDPSGLEYGAEFPWHECLLFLRAFSLSGANPALENVLQEFSQYDEKLYGWAPRVLSDYNCNHESDRVLVGEVNQEIVMELGHLLAVSKRMDSPDKHHSEYTKFPAWIQSSEHMVQAIFEDGVERNNTNCQRWIFFDDLWAAANRNLAESILRYGYSGDAARILSFTGFMDFPLLQNYLESGQWTVWASNAFIETDRTYRCEIRTIGIEISIDGEEGSVIFNNEDDAIAHIRSIFK